MMYCSSSPLILFFHRRSSALRAPASPCALCHALRTTLPHTFRHTRHFARPVPDPPFPSHHSSRACSSTPALYALHSCHLTLLSMSALCTLCAALRSAYSFDLRASISSVFPLTFPSRFPIYIDKTTAHAFLREKKEQTKYPSVPFYLLLIRSAIRRAR